MQRDFQPATLNDNLAALTDWNEASRRRPTMAERIENRPRLHPDQGSLELMEEYIRLRAYELFEARGRQHGYDVEDWLAAEAEVLGTPKSNSIQMRPHQARRAKAA
jgi:hypothetical protein